MATVFNRGTETRPLWYVKYKAADGSWKMVAAKDAKNKGEARRFADSVDERVGKGLPPVDGDHQATPPDAVTCDGLMRQWEATLRTRSVKDDKSRLHRYLLPKWGAVAIARVNLAAIMTWIDELRAGAAPMAAPALDDEGKPKRQPGRAPKGDVLSDATIRHCLNLLSRFFSWAVEREHATVNPVRLIPTGRRPHQTAKGTEAPWLDDDATVRTVLGELPRVVGLVFYLCNRAGLRSGEALGLRLGDLGFLEEGTIRVGHSYMGPLKEDKRRDGKVKWVPAPDDCGAVMGGWLAERRAEGAGADDLVFPSEPSRGKRKRPGGPVERQPERPYRSLFLSRNWNEVAARHGLKMTWYQATRHSFVSRNLSRGASLDEVSSAVGHSSPVVTQRHYNHLVRRSFSPTLRAGLGLAGPDAIVLPFDRAKDKGGK
jgi:integrase